MMNTHFILLLTFQLVNNLSLKPTNLKKCDPKKRYNIEVEVNLTGLVFDGVAKLTKPFDNPATIKVEISPDGSKFMQLSNWHEKNFCKALNHFGGRLWYDVERTAKVIPLGECPIKQGVYMVKQYKIDMSKSALFGLPRGELRVTVTFLDRFTNKIDGCYIVGFQNF